MEDIVATLHVDRPSEVPQAHQLGVGIMAFGTGVSRDALGTYAPAFLFAAVLCMAAATAFIFVRKPMPAADMPIVAYDFGMKYNILRNLRQAGFKVQVLPATTSAAEALKDKPAGVFLSNGPGDPAALGYIVREVKSLIDSGTPIFGICLGHQILGQALGGKTFKLKFGHRGGNQPVKDLATGKVEITSQNHGFAVDAKSLPPDVSVDRINLNDQTVEGFRHKTKPIFCVQYHPEASPGPHDSNPLFAEFRALINKS